MKVLVGCEQSQRVTQEFLNLGIDAFSCDIHETLGKNKDRHIKGDILKVIPKVKPDICILHPPCTALAVSGNRWYSNSLQRIKAISWTIGLWDVAINNSKCVCMENPVGVLFPKLAINYDFDLQYIQPWQFGHPETKKTGLALYNLPKLDSTNIVEGREQKIWRMPPGADRARIRSLTYPGVAKAMAKQWSEYYEKTIQDKEK
jgi:hypothetical protein